MSDDDDMIKKREKSAWKFGIDTAGNRVFTQLR